MTTQYNQSRQLARPREDSGAVNPMNVFASPGNSASGNAVAKAHEGRAIAEIQAAVFMAKQFPRDPVQAMERILNACTRPTLAEAALYSYSRGGAEVSGPSIRLAEAMAQDWGNITFGIQELDQRNGESSVLAFAWDLETNTRRVIEFQVPHIRYTKKGTKRLEDPRDIYEMVANQGARRVRACILAVIPGDVVEAAVKQCELTLATSADASPDAVKKMVQAFKGFGITAEQIARRCQCRLEAIRPAQMVMLRKIYASLHDGMSKPEDWFDPVEMEAPEQSDEPKKNASGKQDKSGKTANQGSAKTKGQASTDKGAQTEAPTEDNDQVDPQATASEPDQTADTAAPSQAEDAASSEPSAQTSTEKKGGGLFTDAE